VFASGARVYIAAIPLSLLLFGDSGAEQPGWQLVTASLLLVGVGIGFTLAGGIASVIWTEVVQTIVLLAAVLAAIALLLHRIPVGPAEILAALQQPGPGSVSKLEVLDLSTDPSRAYTLWTAIVAFTMMGLAAYGTDHDLVQRMLTCKSAVKGAQSAILAVVASIPLVSLFMVIGLLLYIFYQRPDLMGEAAPSYAASDTRKVFLTFILHEMPPGLAGVMMAGLLSVGISSLNSALNAMAATLVRDFYTPAAPGREPRHYVAVGRFAVLGWGVVLAGFACLCVGWQRSSGQNLIDFALGVMTFAYAGLLAVFLTAIFTRRGNTVSAIAAILTGFGVIAALQPAVWALWAPHVKWPLFSAEPTRWMLGDLTLAYPWHLVIASGLAMGVCCLGARRTVPGNTVDAE
jgi:solute:Na+ symporter, SSS family